MLDLSLCFENSKARQGVLEKKDRMPLVSSPLQAIPNVALFSTDDGIAESEIPLVRQCHMGLKVGLQLPQEAAFRKFHK